MSIIDPKTIKHLREDANAIGIPVAHDFFTAKNGSLLESPANAMASSTADAVISVTKTFRSSPFKPLYTLATESNGDITTNRTVNDYIQHNTAMINTLTTQFRSIALAANFESTGFSKEEFTVFKGNLEDLRLYNNQLVQIIREYREILHNVKDKGESANSAEAIDVADLINTILISKVIAVSQAVNILAVITFTNGEFNENSGKRMDLMNSYLAAVRIAIDEEGIDDIKQLMSTLRTSLNESVTAVALIVLPGAAIIIGIYLLIKVAISTYYRLRTMISNNLTSTATSIKVNAHILSATNSKSANEQRKIAEKFMKVSEFFKVEDPDASVKTAKAIAVTNKSIERNTKRSIDASSVSVPDSYDDTYRDSIL